MYRMMGVAVLTLGLVMNVAIAEQYKGKIKSIDSEKSTITITFEEKEKEVEKTFPVSKTAKIYSQQKKKKKVNDVPIEDGLKGLKDGQEVTITTEDIEKTETATQIKLETVMKKKKKKKTIND